MKKFPSGDKVYKVNTWKLFLAVALLATANLVPAQTPGVTEIAVSTWVYLEGSAISPDGAGAFNIPMRTDLNLLHLLPGQTFDDDQTGINYTPAGQPYNAAPWYYNGNEGDAYDSYGDPNPGTANYPPTVVDWVLVSLRGNPDELPLCKKAALLHDDGHVEFLNGPFSFNDLANYTSFFLVIEHRNHLIVMSDTAISVMNGTISYDFRYRQSYINDPFNYGAIRQKELLPELPGVYAMFAGNGDQVKTGEELPGDITGINGNDRTYWDGQNGFTARYLAGDYNMNGDCNFNDRITMEINQGLFTSVPAE